MRALAVAPRSAKFPQYFELSLGRLALMAVKGESQ
jgi:hypothetical protein